MIAKQNKLRTWLSAMGLVMIVFAAMVPAHYAYATSDALTAVEQPIIEDAHAATDSHAGEHKKGLPQFDPSTYTSQIFWLTLTFVVMYAAFAGSIIPKIGTVIDTRKDFVQGNLELAEKLQKEAENARVQYESLLVNARATSTGMINDSIASVKKQMETETASSHEKALKDIAALDKKLGETRDETMKDMNVIVAEIASQAAKKIAGIDADSKQAQSVVQSINDRNKKAA